MYPACGPGIWSVGMASRTFKISSSKFPRTLSIGKITDYGCNAEIRLQGRETVYLACLVDAILTVSLGSGGHIPQAGGLHVRLHLGA